MRPLFNRSGLGTKSNMVDHRNDRIKQLNRTLESLVARVHQMVLSRSSKHKTLDFLRKYACALGMDSNTSNNILSAIFEKMDSHVCI